MLRVSHGYEYMHTATVTATGTATATLRHTSRSMPFRERMRKIFGRRPSGPSSAIGAGNHTTTTATTIRAGPTTSYPPHLQLAAAPGAARPAPPKPNTTSSSFRRSFPKRSKSQRALTYKIGDPMPPPKYPGKYDKPHQDMLRAFSFTSSSALASRRRTSGQSDVSPMGSRWPSRTNSHVVRRSTSHPRTAAAVAPVEGRRRPAGKENAPHPDAEGTDGSVPVAVVSSEPPPSTPSTSTSTSISSANATKSVPEPARPAGDGHLPRPAPATATVA
ncbi:MAG: hypothetical protein M1826_005872 [Phylliscum demangeonii]|nr:MAG: hypothetical protein M1826_005872 [Phylliscum demangeonii]